MQADAMVVSLGNRISEEAMRSLPGQVSGEGVLSLSSFLSPSGSPRLPRRSPVAGVRLSPDWILNDTKGLM